MGMQRTTTKSRGPQNRWSALQLGPGSFLGDGKAADHKTGGPRYALAGALYQGTALAVPWTLAFSGLAGRVADGGFEGKGAFLRLRVAGEVGGEVGEMIETEATAPDLGAELLKGLLGGDA